MPSATFHVLYTPPHRVLFRGLADGLRALACRARQAYGQHQRRRAERAALRQLMALDMHLLRDLGIDRSELMSIAMHPHDRERMRSTPPAP